MAAGKHKIVLGHVGTGGLESLKGKLTDHEVHYGLVRLPYGDTGSHKFVHVCWTGSVPISGVFCGFRCFAAV